MPEMYYSQALHAALDEALARDPDVLLLGEDVGAYGGAFGVTRGLLEKYGPDRIRETPISEAGFVGIAVGAAMTGLKPVVEIMFMDFILLAADQIINHAAKLHYIYDGQVNVPMVIRTPSGAGRGYGASHSQNLESFFLSVAGLKIAVPSNPFDAKGMLAAAIRDPNPVLFIEPKALYGKRGEVPAGHYEVPLGQARIARECRSAAPGRQSGDLTIIAYGAGVEEALSAAKELAEGGLEAEVLDLRTLRPMDWPAVYAAARKTGRCILFEEGPLYGGVGAEIAARLAENCSRDLKSPPIRIGAKDTPIPSAITLERAVTPSAKDICEAVEKLFQ